RPDGSFMPLNNRNRFDAIATFGPQRLRELRSRDLECVADLHYRAGLQPGVYEDGRDLKLVPEFVPLVVASSDDPPAEFHHLWQTLRELGVNDEDREKVRSLQRELITIYEKVRGAKLSTKRAPRIVVRNKLRADSFPGNDHTNLFCGPAGEI